MAVATVSSSGPRRHLVWVEKLGATAGWLPALLSFQTIRAVSSSVGFLENTALSFGSESGYSAWLSPLHVTARLLAPTDVSPSDFSTQTFAEHLLCARYHVHIIISFHSNLRKEVVISSPVLLMRRQSFSEAVQPAKCYHTGKPRTLSSPGLPARIPYSSSPGVLASAHTLPPPRLPLVLRCTWGLGDSRTDRGATELPELTSTFTFYLNNKLLG